MKCESDYQDLGVLYYVPVYTIHGIDTPHVLFLTTHFGLMGPLIQAPTLESKDRPHE
jgi:hypothetical protein